MRVENLKRDWLEITDWKVGDGEIWCLHGGNASGKTWLASLLSGEVEADSGAIHERPKRTRCVSFETQQAVYQKEIANDDTDYLGRIDTGTTVREMLQQGGCSEGDVQLAAKSFSLEATLDRGYRLLSSGEARKIMLLREFMAKPDLLILDEPFEGLDAEASEAFSTACAAAISEGLQIMLFINRVEDIQDWTTHLALLSRGRLVAQGPREAVLSSSEVQQMLSLDRGPLPDLPTPATSELSVADPLVIFQNVKVQYGATIQFQKFDWTLAKGEHTVVTGPNGAGKSTLLQLLTGDHPQCYSNRIQIFGYQRGSGESIWDIKRLIGIVSPALHRDYRVSADVLSVVVSGCYDTIGLYRSQLA